MDVLTQRDADRAGQAARRGLGEDEGGRAEDHGDHRQAEGIIGKVSFFAHLHVPWSQVERVNETRRSRNMEE